MLHPSYLELMNAVNANSESNDGKPVVTSRYSIVVAAAQRARQLIEEEVQDADNYVISKPLSTAIGELMDGKVTIIPGDDNYPDFTESAVMQTAYGASVSIDSDSDESESEEDEDYTDDEESFDDEEESFDDESFDDEDMDEEPEEF
jgi:DNA-directed RNA polymerase subunit omega